MKNRIFIHIALVGMLAASVMACGNSKNTTNSKESQVAQAIVGPEFVADSAYAYCKAQCDFGPRTMNSEAHERCGMWIANKFREFGLEVTEQKADLKAFDGTTLKATNIIASHNSTAKERILVCAHWDSRPWADNDPDSANWRKPVVGANDGASGVAVMLELARLIAKSDSLAVGVDYI